jgi:chromosome segregation ATPase
MSDKLLDAINEVNGRLIEIKKDLEEIKEKQGEHDRKFNTIAETLENVFNLIGDTNDRLDVLTIDTHKNKAEINRLKKAK